MKSYGTSLSHCTFSRSIRRKSKVVACSNVRKKLYVYGKENIVVEFLICHWYVNNLIQIYFKKLQIKFKERFENWDVLGASFSIDGTDCLIQEPTRPIVKEWYSNKFKHAGLRYEIGMQINGSKILWVSGGVPA